MSALPLDPPASAETLREKVAAAEEKFPGITMWASAWHATEIIKRLDRLIELAEQRAAREAGR